MLIAGIFAALYVAIGCLIALYTLMDNHVNPTWPQPSPITRGLFWPILVLAGLLVFMWDCIMMAGGAFKPRR